MTIENPSSIPPTAAADQHTKSAVNRLVAKGHIINISLLREPSGLVVTNPGTTYIRIVAGNPIRDLIPGDDWKFTAIRLYTVGSGNEAGSGKGVRIYNNTDGTQLVENTWNGTARTVVDSGWKSIEVTKDITILPQVKASSTTEDITLETISVWLRSK